MDTFKLLVKRLVASVHGVRYRMLLLSTRHASKMLCRKSANIEGAPQAMSSTSITSQDARMIYEVKRDGKTPHDAARLAMQYGITAKAVRDIWAHRTWKLATVSLWTLHEAKEYVKTKLCANCHCAVAAGISLENATRGCAKCVRFAQKFLGAKEDHNMPKVMPHHMPKVMPHFDEAERHGRVTSPVPPLQRRMDQVWIRKNAQLGGLMDEALDTV